MTDLPHANRFQDLLVYKKARALAKQVFELSEEFPRDEIYSLTSQVRRSSRSAGVQIAEAWARRRYEKHSVSKLIDADGEQMETQHWLESAVGFGYVSRECAAPMLAQCMEVGRMLGDIISKAELFCNPEALSVREEEALYFAPSTEN